MLRFHKRTDTLAARTTLTLGYSDRRKTRLRAKLDDGREAALLLPRGSILRDGDCLFDPAANVAVVIKAAAETLSMARAGSHHMLCRAAYHLGNRHVPVQLGTDWLAYEHDHVLDEMVRSLGLEVSVETRPFEPEAGGYGHGRSGSQTDDHSHPSHPHAH